MAQPSHEAPPCRRPAVVRRRRRLPWADLLYRVLGIDALRCDDCGGRYERIADIRDPDIAAAILRALGLPDTPLPILPARPPPDDARPDPCDDDPHDDPGDWEQDDLGDLDRTA